MPLLDHFHPPLARTHPWRSFHGSWANAIARLLNAGGLPPGYYALPFLDDDGPIEIDIAVRGDADEVGTGSPEAWSPDPAAVSVAVDLPAADAVRVEVFADDGDPQLVAAIELISPRNKDRPAARQAFAGKCAARVRQGCGLVFVDVVTTRRADMHVELMSALGAEAAPVGGLAAVAYRATGRDDTGRIDCWPVALELGRPLPALPLWLLGGPPVRLDLDASYAATCDDLRVRRAG